MREKFEDIDELLKQISLEQGKYQAAIQDDKTFEEVKKIYLRIKDYQKRLQVLMRKTDNDLIELGVLACSLVFLSK